MEPSQYSSFDPRRRIMYWKGFTCFMNLSSDGSYTNWPGRTSDLQVSFSSLHKCVFFSDNLIDTIMINKATVSSVSTGSMEPVTFNIISSFNRNINILIQLLPMLCYIKVRFCRDFLLIRLITLFFLFIFSFLFNY